MRSARLLPCFATAGVLCLLTPGCTSSSHDTPQPIPLQPSAAHRDRSFMSHAVSAPGAQLVYLSAFVAGTVFVYDQARTNQKPIGQIGGLSAPAGITITPKGDLYVASQSNGSVSAFHIGSTTPFKVFTGGKSLQGVAVDNKGTVYANNGFSNQIYVWSHGSTVTTNTLIAGFTDNCDDIAVDAKGNLFVDSLFGEFEEFRAGSTTPLKLFSVGSHVAPFAIAIDSKRDLVTTFTDGTIITFPPPYNGSTSGSFKHTGLIYAIALAQSEDLLWGGNMTGPNGTVGQAYGFPKGKLLKTTSGVDISGDSILGVATYPPAQT